MQPGKTAGPSTSKGYPLYPSVPNKEKYFLRLYSVPPKYTIFFSIPSMDAWLSELSNLLIFQGCIFFLRVMNTICATWKRNLTFIECSLCTKYYLSTLNTLATFSLKTMLWVRYCCTPYLLKQGRKLDLDPQLATAESVPRAPTLGHYMTSLL